MTSTTLAAPARLRKLLQSVLLLLPFLPLLLLASPGCSDDSSAPPDAPLVDGGDIGDAAPDLARPRKVITPDRTISVTLDGTARAGAVVSQGGNPTRWRTGVDGTVAVHLDVTIPGDMWVMASLPQARIGSAPITPNGPLVIALSSFTTQDGDNYEFQHPGTPDKYNYDTSFCAPRACRCRVRCPCASVHPRPRTHPR